MRYDVAKYASKRLIINPQRPLGPNLKISTLQPSGGGQAGHDGTSFAAIQAEMTILFKKYIFFKSPFD